MFTALGRSQFSLLILCSFISACRVMIAKAGINDGLLPFQMGFVTNLFAGVMLFLWVRQSGEKIPLGRNYLLLYFVLGIVNFAYPNVLTFLLIENVGPAYASTVYSLSPLLTMTFAAGFGIERMYLRRFIGIAIGFLGLMLLVEEKFSAINFDETFWVLFGLTVPASVAIGNIIRSAFWPKGSSPMAFACANLLVSSVLIAATAPIFEDVSQWQFGHIDIIFWLAVLSVVSAGSYALNYRLQQIAGPVVLSQIGYWGTGFGVLLAALLFDDVLPLLSLLGIAGIICGGVLANRRRKAKVVRP
ncbi:MAG: DMT family transporter [Hyphomicrobiales bacterium]